VCVDFSTCPESHSSPFCFNRNSGDFTCEAQHWLVVGLIVLVMLCLCCCILGICCLGFQRELGRRRSHRSYSRPQSQASLDRGRVLRVHASEAVADSSLRGAQEGVSGSRLQGQGGRKDAEPPSVDIIHCIGEPPGHFEVVEVGGRAREEERVENPQRSLLVDANSGISAGGEDWQVYGTSSPSTPPPRQRERDTQDPMRFHPGDSWDIPVEAVAPPAGCEPAVSSRGSRGSSPQDPQWDHAMRIVDRTTREISRVMAEVRTAPRRRKSQLFQRLRELESDPLYLEAKRYLEDDPLPDSSKSSFGMTLCCMGGSQQAGPSRLHQRDPLEAPCAVCWGGGDEEEVLTQRSSPRNYPFAL